MMSTPISNTALDQQFNNARMHSRSLRFSIDEACQIV